MLNTGTSLEDSTLRGNSWLFWGTLVLPIAILAIGINFILNPVGDSTAYGVPIYDPAAFPFLWVKDIRGIFSDLAVLAFLWRGRPAHHSYPFCPCHFHPVRRWAGHSAPSWLCATDLYSLSVC